jgi:Spy/CpxP family protein refolding chaperone
MLGKVIIISAVVITIVILLAACRSKFSHCWAHGDPEKKVNWITKKISSELDLNDTQKEKLNSIKEEILAKHSEFKSTNKREEHLNRFLEEIKKDSLDREFLVEISDEKMQHFEEIRSFAVEKLIEFHAILTPEQKEKLAEKITEFHEKFHKE